MESREEKAKDINERCYKTHFGEDRRTSLR